MVESDSGNILEGFSEIAIMLLELYLTKYHIQRGHMTPYEIVKSYKFKKVELNTIVYNNKYNKSMFDIYIGSTEINNLFHQHKRLKSWSRII